jgi:hypothetical protein
MPITEAFAPLYALIGQLAVLRSASQSRIASLVLVRRMVVDPYFAGRWLGINAKPRPADEVKTSDELEELRTSSTKTGRPKSYDVERSG